MNPSGPAFVPALFFLGGYTRSQRAIFLFLLALVTLSGGLLLYSTFYPTDLPLTIAEVAETAQSSATVDKVTYHYRDYALQLPVFHQTVTFAASPIQVPGWLLIAFVLMQLVGWSASLAAASQMQSRWSYAFFALFATWLHSTHIYDVLLPGDNAVAIELLLQVLLLGLAYAFQQNLLRVTFLFRWLALLAILGVAFGIVWFKHGYPGLHLGLRNGFSYLAFLAPAFLIFMGKEPLALLMYLGTNQREATRRLPLPLIVSISVLWLVSTLLMMVPYYKPAAGLHNWLNPSVVLAVASILTVFLSQNLYKPVEQFFKNHFSFTIQLLAWVLVMISHFAMSQGRGAFIYMFDSEGIAAACFAGGSLGYLIYVLANYLPLIKIRTNIYFILANGPKFPIAIVWLVTLVPLILAEGSTSWRTIQVISGELVALDGDQAFMEGDNTKAARAYRAVTEVLPTEVRSNYNFACLISTSTENAQTALTHFRKSTELVEFPPARINAGNIFLVSETPKGALRELNGRLQQAPYYVLNNLALAYRRVGMADSAVSCLKRALVREPDFSAGYANLSEIYFENGKNDWGLKFAKAALDCNTPSPVAISNSIYRNLHDGSRIELKDIEITSSIPYASAYNSVLWLMHKGEIARASQGAQQLNAEGTLPEAIILDAYLRFRADSVEHGMSRTEYVAKAFPDHAGDAWYAMGVAFAGKKVPEMARFYFAQAAQAGHPKAGLYAATLNIDLNRPDSAQAALSRLRVQHQELWQDVSREMAIMLHAYNQPVFAETEFPAANFTRNDQMRIALLADSTNRYVTALETFRSILAADSNDVAPYLELGRIYNKYSDNRALETLKLGQKKAPNNPEVQLALAEAYSLAGNTAEARKLCEPLVKSADANTAADARLLAARIALREGDRKQGAAMLQEAIKRNPLHREAILSLFNLSMETNDWETANRTVTQAVRTNTQNAELWAAYALISRQWGLSEDAGFGAAKAIELTTDPARKQELSSAFAPELRLLTGKQ